MVKGNLPSTLLSDSEHKSNRKTYAVDMKRRAFARAYVDNGYNAQNAALASGLSKNAASAATLGKNYAENEYVKAIIEGYTREKELASIVTREWVLVQLVETIEAAKKGRTLGENGEFSVKAEFDGNTVIKSCAEISKIMKFYDSTTVNNHLNQTNISISADNKILIELTQKYDAQYDK